MFTGAASGDEDETGPDTSEVSEQEQEQGQEQRQEQGQEQGLDIAELIPTLDGFDPGIIDILPLNVR